MGSVGFVYPWALRPSLDYRGTDYDHYNYGNDNIPWSEDDDYMYYGSTVSESWFTRLNPSSNTDWQATSNASMYTHNLNTTLGDHFGDTPYISSSNDSPVLAHSNIVDTWPINFNNPFWPGSYAETYAPDETNCFPPATYNDYCWVSTNYFASNSDIYLEFDDRWAHRGSQVLEIEIEDDENEYEYESTGYPMGIKVITQGHSYSFVVAEDILFFTMPFDIILKTSSQFFMYLEISVFLWA